MKKNLFALFAVRSIHKAFYQSIEVKVLSSLANCSEYFSCFKGWRFGEFVTEKVTSSKNYLTQEFQQNNNDFTSINNQSLQVFLIEMPINP